MPVITNDDSIPFLHIQDFKALMPVMVSDRICIQSAERNDTVPERDMFKPVGNGSRMHSAIFSSFWIDTSINKTYF